MRKTRSADAEPADAGPAKSPTSGAVKSPAKSGAAAAAKSAGPAKTATRAKAAAPAKAAAAKSAGPAKAAKASKATAPGVATAVPAQPAGDETAPDEVPMNRAERRRKGKKTVPEPGYSRVLSPGRRGPMAGSRNFATRRSG